VAGLSIRLAAALVAVSLASLFAALQARKLAEVEHQGKQQLEQARDDLELARARSLVRPLSQSRRDALGEPEVEALWELAQQPGEQFRWRFLQEAMRTPVTAGQLRGRAEPTWIAVVGLDPDRRDRTLRMLAERFADERLTVQHRLDLAEAALVLGGLTDADAEQIAGVYLSAWASNPAQFDPDTLACRTCEAAHALRPSLAAHVLTTCLEKAPRALERRLFNEELSGIVHHWGPADAMRLARALGQALEKESKSSERRYLAEGLASVIARLERGAAAPLAERGARALAQTLEKEPETVERQNLARALAKIARSMRPEEATSLLTEALAKQSNLGIRVALFEGLPDSEKPVHGPRLAWALARGIAMAPKVSDCRDLAEGLAEVVGSLETAERARVLGHAARTLAEAIEKEKAADNCVALASGLSAVAGRMSPASAAALAATAARPLARSLEKEADVAEHRKLAEALASAAMGMKSAEAVCLLAEALEKEADANAGVHLVGGLEKVVQRLEPGEAPPELEQAARILVIGLAKDRATDCRSSLARGLASVAERLEPHEWARTLGLCLEKPLDAYGRAYFALQIANLTGNMPAEQAALAARRAAHVLAQALQTETKPYHHALLAMGVAALAERLSPDEARELCRSALATVLQTIPAGMT
jgi:hypothetical protein